MDIKTVPLCSLFGLVFLAVSCSPPAKPESRKNRASGGEEVEAFPGTATEGDEEAPAGKSKPKGFTDAEKETLKAFGQTYARAVSSGDDAAAKAGWNLDALMEISLGTGAKVSPEFTRELKRGFVDALNRKPGGLMWATFGQPWRVLRVHEVDGETRILCRVATEGAINYIDLVPRLNEKGEPEIVDAYIFGSGEKFSKTFARLLLPQIAEESKTPIEKLLTKPDPLVKHLGEFAEFSMLFQRQDYLGCLERFKALPSAIQDEKAALLLYLGAAIQLMTDEEDPVVDGAYRDGITRFHKLFADDPAFLLMGIDYYFLQEDYQGASEAIDKLDKAIGGDPYLDFFRASVLMSEEKFAEALPLAQAALEADPEIEDPCWGVVNIQLTLGNFEAVAEGLDRLVEKFDYVFELDKDPAYEEFAKSAVGKAWMEKHAASQGN